MAKKKAAPIQNEKAPKWALIYTILPHGEVVLSTCGAGAGVFCTQADAASHLAQIADEIRLTPPVPPPPL